MAKPQEKIQVLLSKADMKRLRELEYKAQSAISPAEFKVYEKEIKMIIAHGVELAEYKAIR